MLMISNLFPPYTVLLRFPNNLKLFIIHIHYSFHVNKGKITRGLIKEHLNTVLQDFHYITLHRRETGLGLPILQARL